MHTVNALAHGWREKITLLVWGATATLVCDNPAVRRKLQAACVDQLGISETLKELGIEVTYWGRPLYEILKNGVPLLTLRPQGKRPAPLGCVPCNVTRRLVAGIRLTMPAAGAVPASAEMIVSERRLW